MPRKSVVRLTDPPDMTLDVYFLSLLRYPLARVLSFVLQLPLPLARLLRRKYNSGLFHSRFGNRSDNTYVIHKFNLRPTNAMNRL